jgi:hypothetical protein
MNSSFVNANTPHQLLFTKHENRLADLLQKYLGAEPQRFVGVGVSTVRYAVNGDLLIDGVCDSEAQRSDIAAFVKTREVAAIAHRIPMQIRTSTMRVVPIQLMGEYLNRIRLTHQPLCTLTVLSVIQERYDAPVVIKCESTRYVSDQKAEVLRLLRLIPDFAPRLENGIELHSNRLPKAPFELIAINKLMRELPRAIPDEPQDEHREMLLEVQQWLADSPHRYECWIICGILHTALHDEESAFRSFHNAAFILVTENKTHGRTFRNFQGELRNVVESKLLAGKDEYAGLNEEALLRNARFRFDEHYLAEYEELLVERAELKDE